MRSICIIPVRMGSSRFYGKPLKFINGIAMSHVCYKNAQKSKFIDRVFIATPDIEIRDYFKKINIDAVMTSIKHQRASDRTYEALIKIEKKYNKKIKYITMLQGDEPMITSQMIDNATKSLIKNKKIGCVNLMSEIKTRKEAQDKNLIKVVTDKSKQALYFSREPIPNGNLDNSGNYFKQVCVMPFRREYLIKFHKLKPTLLEKNESIDMLRFLENNIKVQMVITKKITQSVDTLSDLKKVKRLLKKN